MNNRNNSSKNNKNRATNGRNRNFKPQSKFGEVKKCDENAIRIDRDPANDVSWYTKNPQLLKDSASLSFFNPLGNAYPLKYYNLESIGYQDSAYSNGIPGILALHLAPTIGISTGPASSANVAARNIYSYVRHANSGHANYEAPDLFMYLMAVSSAYSYFAHLCRAYGVLRYYNQKNKYLPTSMITALGFAGPNDVTNIATLRQRINYLGVKLRSLYVPNTMSYFIRQMWCYTGVYKDAAADKAQLYVYVPEYVFKWSSTGSRYGTSLEPYWLYADNGLPQWTLAESCDILNGLLDALLSDEDAGIMGGDLLKAYGQDKMFQLRELSEDYIVEPAFSEEVLNQIHNASIMGMNPRCCRGTEVTDEGGVKFGSDFKVTQDPDTGYIKFNPVWYVDASQSTSKGFAMEDIASGVPFALAKEQYLDLSYDDATPERIMVASRLTTCAVITNKQGATMDKDNYVMGITGCGSEIVTRAQLFSVDNGGNTTITTLEGIDVSSTMYFNSAATVPVSSANNLMNTLNMLGYFAMAPRVHTGMINDSRRLFSTGVCGDLYNFTTVNFQDINRMHDAAVLSEFDVPVS